MKTIGNIITGMAAFMFMLGMCTIDGNTVFSLCTMFISGIVLAIASYIHEEKRLREGRR